MANATQDSTASGAISEFAEQASKTVGAAAERASGIVKDVREQAGEAAASIEEGAEWANKSLHVSLRTQPLTTLAVAALIGFAIGAIWKS